MSDTKNLVIAYDAKRLFNNQTGLGNFSRTLLRTLQRDFPEHQYHLFTPNAVRNSETEYFFDSSKFTIHTPTFPQPLWRSWFMSKEINGLKPDIFHGLSHELPWGLDKSIRTVLSFHDLIYEKYPEQFGWFNSLLYQYKYRSSVQRANCVVAVSQSTKEDLKKIYHCQEELLRVVYQTCSDTFILQPPNLTSLDQTKSYFLYVGSIIERKGLLQSIIAYGQLPKEFQIPFVIVGNGDKKYLDKVHKMIEYYNIKDKIKFINGLPNSDLVQLYDKSLALVLPSIYEGFGIPVIESLFRSKPVITSNISSLPEASGPGAILVNPYDQGSIKKAMIDIQDKPTYVRLSKEGKSYVEKTFNPSVITQQWIKIYMELIVQELQPM